MVQLIHKHILNCNIWFIQVTQQIAKAENSSGDLNIDINVKNLSV